MPAGAVAGTVVVPYNDEAALDEAFARHGPQLAAVIVEGVAANMGLVPPADGFLDGLRRRCSDAGALLIMDEVITGFRLGDDGAQGRYGIEPDLSCFGKVLGGGLPLAAFGGRAEIMDHLAPLGPVYQAGTLSGNPLATAAGLAVLARLDAAAYATLEATATTLADGLRQALTSAGLAVQVPQVGPAGGPVLLRLARSSTTPRPRPPTRSATPASSTRCWTGASTSPPARSRRSSPAWPTAPPRSKRSSPPRPKLPPRSNANH